MQFKVMIARFPFLASEHPDVTEWFAETVMKAKADPRISEVITRSYNDTPITMTRNLALKDALDNGVDFVTMVDSDMKPDAYLASNPNKLGTMPRAKPFWESSLSFMLDHRQAGLGPSMVAAPYGGPPPFENVYVFQWINIQSDHPEPDGKLEAISREEAARWTGILEVGALPTGLCMIDTGALSRLPPPWFEYEYADPPFNTRKATTEDVFFTRNMSLAGMPVYCNWDAWAGHWKRKCVGVPRVLTVESVRERFRETIVSGRRAADQLVYVKDGQPLAEAIKDKATPPKKLEANGSPKLDISGSPRRPAAAIIPR